MYTRGVIDSKIIVHPRTKILKNPPQNPLKIPPKSQRSKKSLGFFKSSFILK